LTEEQRREFDAMLERAIDDLPEHYKIRLEEIPVVVEDRPSAEILKDLGLDDAEGLAGLHTGVALTDRSVEDEMGLPDEIRIFRCGVVEVAGGWDAADAAEQIGEEIRITLLHELGHHFGLDEDDLTDLGYD